MRARPHRHNDSIDSPRQKSHPIGVVFLFGKGKDRESNQSNATVRWTVARCGLDRIDTMIQTIPLGKRSHPIGVVFLFGKGKDGESNQSNATVRWTVARCGLDRIDTMIQSILLGKCPHLTAKLVIAKSAEYFSYRRKHDYHLQPCRARS